VRLLLLPSRGVAGSSTLGSQRGHLRRDASTQCGELSRRSAELASPSSVAILSPRVLAVVCARSHSRQFAGVPLAGCLRARKRCACGHARPRRSVGITGKGGANGLHAAAIVGAKTGVASVATAIRSIRGRVTRRSGVRIAARVDGTIRRCVTGIGRAAIRSAARSASRACGTCGTCAASRATTARGAGGPSFAG
jgi:hypothetical protein